MAWPTQNCNRLGHFQSECELQRCAGEDLLPCVGLWKLVKRKIPTNRWKCLGVFSQTISFKLCLREFASRDVLVVRIDRAHPTGVLPGGAAEADSFVGPFFEDWS